MAAGLFLVLGSSAFAFEVDREFLAIWSDRMTLSDSVLPLIFEQLAAGIFGG